MGLYLFRRFWSDSHPKSDSNISMLHNLVAPVMVHAFSTYTAPSCFLDWINVLSHTESHYSKIVSMI